MSKKKVTTGAFASALLIAASLLVSAPAAQAAGSVVWDAQSAPFTCSGRDQYVLLKWNRSGAKFPYELQAEEYPAFERLITGHAQFQF